MVGRDVRASWRSQVEPFRVTSGRSAGWIAGLWLVMAGLTCCAEEAGVRVRMSWSGGAVSGGASVGVPQSFFQGTVTLSDGVWEDLQPLGFEAGQSRRFTVAGNVLQVHGTTLQTYGGCDVLARAPLDAKVTVTPAPELGAPAADPREFVLRDLLREPYSLRLNPNLRWHVRRSPGDALRVNLHRDHLVFRPSETWSIDVIPVHSALSGEGPLRCAIRLVLAGTSQSLWESESDLAVDDRGEPVPIKGLQVSVPDREGVFELVLSVTRGGMRHSIIPLPSRAEVTRTIQLIVVEEQTTLAVAPTADSSGSWTALAAFDPTESRWWERLARISQTRHLPATKLLPTSLSGPTSFGQTEIVRRQERSWAQLAGEGWYAYPIPVSAIGQPHRVEIDYPRDQPQVLVASIVEAGAGDTVMPVGRDWGWSVTPSAVASDTAAGTQQLVFWPRTVHPYLLLSNPLADVQSAFGTIRVLAGPAKLEPLTPPVTGGGRRIALAHFGRPLFPESFGASEAIDVASKRTFDDWTTFYQGASRLAQYLHYAGYGGAAIAVHCEGSTIYPSRLLESSPKYDTGTFFSTGQDPVRKDVLELLLRVFDRDQLTLVPVLQFNAPLPALERLRTSGDHGVALVDRDGQDWVDRFGSHHGMAPYYNPLDDRVQLAVEQVVRELVRRYAPHRSFSGLTLDLSPQGYLQLPGVDWGWDDRTLNRFATETGILGASSGSGTLAPSAESELKAIREWIDQHPEAWIDWRAEVISKFHQRLQQAAEEERPGTMLYLTGTHLIDAPAVRETIMPSLPRRARLDDSIRAMGIDPKRYPPDTRVVLLRMHRWEGKGTWLDQAVLKEYNQSEDVDRFCGTGQIRGSHYFHEPTIFQLRSFDDRHPFGKPRMPTWLTPAIMPAGNDNLKRFAHSLATLDSQTLLEGGWTVPMGQEDTLREFLDTYRRLPARRFRDVRGAETVRPLVVRTAVDGDQLTAYFVNDSPWTIRVHVQLSCASECRWSPLSPRQSLPAMTDKGGQASAEFQMTPYQLLAAVITPANAEIQRVSVQLPDDLPDRLRSQVAELSASASRLRDFQPISGVRNADFEMPAQDGEIPGWVRMEGGAPGMTLQRDMRYQGTQSLQLLGGEGGIAVQSEPISTPTTGRIALQVWSRVPGDQPSTELRVGISYRHQNAAYYRHAVVQNPPTTPGAEPQWRRFLLPITDLPASQLDDVRVRFDLTGPGTAWIDQVEVSDQYFLDTELRELSRVVTLLDYQLREGMVADCAHGLNGFWPQYLLRHAEGSLMRVAKNRPAQIGDSRGKKPAEVPGALIQEKTQESTQDAKSRRSMLDRVKRMTPRWRKSTPP